MQLAYETENQNSTTNSRHPWKDAAELISGAVKILRTPPTGTRQVESLALLGLARSLQAISKHLETADASFYREATL